MSFTLDADAGGFVQTVGLNQGEGNVPVQLGVLGKVDQLLDALAQKLLDLVTAIGEGGELGR